MNATHLRFDVTRSSSASQRQQPLVVCRRAIRLQNRNVLLQRFHVGKTRAFQRQPAAERIAHGADQIDLVRRAGGRNPGALPILRWHLGERGAHQIGQLEVLEEDVENLVLPHRELEIVLGIARCRGVLAASALPALRLLDLIARKEIAISREHEIARPALFRIEPETRLLGALRRDADLAVFGDVGDAESLSDFCTASRICARARRKKRCRLARLLPLGFRRRSMK
jgi:hypothetical protein